MPLNRLLLVLKAHYRCLFRQDYYDICCESAMPLPFVHRIQQVQLCLPHRHHHCCHYRDLCQNLKFHHLNYYLKLLEYQAVEAVRLEAVGHMARLTGLTKPTARLP
jgi:hypothetical protein